MSRLPSQPDCSDSISETPRGFRAWFTKLVSPEWLGLGVVVLAAALTMAPNTTDPDLWGHVQFGRDVLKSQQIPATTSYSYTAEGFRWINHENLSELIMAWTVDHVGPGGLIVGKLLLSLLVIGTVLAVNLRQGTGVIVASIMTLLVAANLSYHWSFRPQVSSFVAYTFLLLILQKAFADWQHHWHWPFPTLWFHGSGLDAESYQKPSPAEPNFQLRWCWCLAPVMIFWANAHGGFVAGMAILFCYLSCRGLEVCFRLGHYGYLRACQLVLLGLGLCSLTLLNPYGYQLHSWLIESLGQPRPEISDWSNRELFTLVGMKLWGLVAIAVFALSLTKRSRDATHFILLALTLWQSISHFRHVPFFAIACGLWLGPHLQSAMERLSSQQTTTSLSAWGQMAVRVALLIAMITIGFRLMPRLQQIEVKRSEYPVDAIQFMRENQLHGRLVVTYDWAQYAIGALCSEEFNQSRRSRVAFDGRFRTCYPQPIVDMHFDFLYGRVSGVQRQRSSVSPPIDPSRVLKHLEPHLVLLRRSGELTEQHMQTQQEDWVLLYQDAIAQLWGRRTWYDDPQSPQYVSANHRLIHDRLATDSVSWPAITPAPFAASFANHNSTHPSLTLSQGTR